MEKAENGERTGGEEEEGEGVLIRKRQMGEIGRDKRGKKTERLRE